MQKRTTSRTPKFVTTLSVNMDPFTFARIITSFYGVRTQKSTRNFRCLYVRLGDLVVSVPKLRGQAYHRMLRNTLTAIAAYPEYISKMKPSRLRYTHSIWEKWFFKKIERKYMNVPIMTLLHNATLSLILIRSSLCGGHLKLTISPDVRATTYSLHNSVCSLTLLLKERLTSHREKRFPK